MIKNQFQVLREIAAEQGIAIKVAKPGDASKQGIHKLYPDMHDMHDAMDVAQRDGFTTIYIHNSNTWKK